MGVRATVGRQAGIGGIDGAGDGHFDAGRGEFCSDGFSIEQFDRVRQAVAVPGRARDVQAHLAQGLHPLPDGRAGNTQFPGECGAVVQPAVGQARVELVETGFHGGQARLSVA
ncbi:MAG: hypothetical protein U5L08_11370 [Xanthomonadales bacterium]|nr:hypothetical protein [Xanthomonadales bacterium]